MHFLELIPRKCTLLFFLYNKEKFITIKEREDTREGNKKKKKNGITSEEIRPKEVGTHPCDKMELILGYKR